ncbi:BLUF domain-containing protein [Spirosoma sp. KUDC1026]|uniref:BLUF domain-containing protein n=1 Tax=Spirosoma sp. KUDC1026 TaxID=2745947 RepID=UPI00159BD424|nr:BLUF domain-containing protein [Spirosoma sp. KUDC1026]QKZ14386.1 BLUF domain-containing protein [Spirosoma sp. KUDC1026]
MDHCIVYFSSSVKQFQEEDLTNILQQSRQNNSQIGVTGVMLYVRGSIIQVLEGEKATVESLYQRIENDPRHHNVVRVFSRPISQRLFAHWNMGYETITTRQLEEVKRTVNLDTPDESFSPANDHIILKTIKVFYDSNRYN